MAGGPGGSSLAGRGRGGSSSSSARPFARAPGSGRLAGCWWRVASRWPRLRASDGSRAREGGGRGWSCGRPRAPGKANSTGHGVRGRRAEPADDSKANQRWAPLAPASCSRQCPPAGQALSQASRQRWQARCAWGPAVPGWEAFSRTGTSTTPGWKRRCFKTSRRQRSFPRSPARPWAPTVSAPAADLREPSLAPEWRAAALPGCRPQPQGARDRRSSPRQGQ